MKQIAFFLLLIVSIAAQGQKVGLVLSGGGATAISHLGVLIALEEEGIPIDYITGTSMGALIGGLYSAGYSPEQILGIIASEHFKNMTNGIEERQNKYFFKRPDDNASIISIKLRMDTTLQTSLPTNVINPANLDFNMMKMFAGASAKANYKFDSLFVPFRCVASDIESKEAVIFKEGNLSQAIRASMSFPFYLKPLKVNNRLLFDGGLYNNFPIDVMYDEFMPDIIIGSNVTSNTPPPTEDDLVSQIQTMLRNKTDYSTECPAATFVIEPKGSVGTFSFKEAQKMIDEGYSAAKKRIKEIKASVHKKVLPQDLALIRQTFRSQVVPLSFGEINITGINRHQAKYVRHLLIRSKKKSDDVDHVEKGYYRIWNDDKISRLYPLTRYNRATGKYDLNLDVKKEKEIVAEFGGNFSNNPINQAFIGLQLNYLGNTGISLSGNSYFGKLYGSAQGKLRWDVPFRLPFYLEASYTRNRYDYYNSRATFFEDVNPSFFVQHEDHETATVGFPISYWGRFKAGGSMFQLEDEYYQTRLFQAADTTDKTYFDGNTAFGTFEYSTLNDKQYANRGTKFTLDGRLIDGVETTVPGTTSNDSIRRMRLHTWYRVKAVYETYYKNGGNVRLGAYGEFVYSSQDLFLNYSASVLQAPAFTPTPESKTLFLESFRSFKYFALGHKVIFNLHRNVQLRVEGYLFQPFQEIIQETTQDVTLGGKLRKRYTIASTALVYKTPVGPVSLSLNYYHNNPEVAISDNSPLTVFFHFGYVIFNKRALR